MPSPAASTTPSSHPTNSRAERDVQNVANEHLSGLFTGSTKGAHRAARLLSGGATAGNVGADLEKYLTRVFERRGTWRSRFNLAAANLSPATYKPKTRDRPAG